MKKNNKIKSYSLFLEDLNSYKNIFIERIKYL